MRFTMVAIVAALAVFGLVQVNAEILEMHGSGTTNPSKLYAQVMDILEERAKQPVSLTYRAVGSGTGQKEFVGLTAEGNAAYNHFGSGDIPLTTEKYDELTAAGIEAMQFPFILGAISFFHSIPGADLSGGQLFLDGCTLAKIFAREITTWDDAAIIALNPDLKVPAGQAINVVRRVYGSSSTTLASQYLEMQAAEDTCDLDWSAIGSGGGDADKEDPSTPIKAPFWPEGTIPAQGSSKVSAYISENAYSIGYLDSGHGHDDGHAEIELKNKAGEYLSSKEADIGAAALQVLDALPAATGSWAEVSLLDKDGATTWPLTTFTYIYVRRDLSGLGPTAGLVKAFVQFMLEEGQTMVEAFSFVRIPTEVATLGLAALDDLIMPANVEWTFETATDAYVGMGERVFSVKRRSYAEIERNQMLDEIATLKVQMERVMDKITDELGPIEMSPEDYEASASTEAEDYEHAPSAAEDYEEGHAPSATEDYEEGHYEEAEDYEHAPSAAEDYEEGHYEEGSSDSDSDASTEALAALALSVIAMVLSTAALIVAVMARGAAMRAAGSGAPNGCLSPDVDKHVQL